LPLAGSWSRLEPDSSSINTVSFHPHAQRNAFRRRDVHLQSRTFAHWNQSLRRSPQLYPALLRLSAALLIVVDYLRHRSAHFKVRAHLLDLRSLLFNMRGEGSDFFLLLRERPF
jgi:hypothetical protein